MKEEVQCSNVVFFLGAGASVAAEVPHTYSFVEEFKKKIQFSEKSELLEKIIEILKKWKGAEIDIELLLETLTKLRDKNEEPLLQFYEKKFLLENYPEKEPLINDLKDFIKEKAIVPEYKIMYLKPLRDFIEEMKTVDMISVNYDTCIEQFCNSYKLNYQDGFDVHWNPNTFKSEHAHIRLYKLHGSVMWYQSDRGSYIKLPVMTGKNKIQLITGETAENLMLYPMQKWNYAEPLLELLVHVKRILESDACKFVIVVGYSFRDEHITKIFWDSARRNNDLHVVLIDPSAQEIYEKRLQFYDGDHSIPSSLDGKVICLPYKFEKVFSSLKNYYLKNLREGLAKEKELNHAESNGEKVNWQPVLTLLSNAEFVEKCERILSALDQPIQLERSIVDNFPAILEVYLKMILNLIINKQNAAVQGKLEIFFRLLRETFIQGINADISLPVINIRFNKVNIYDVGVFQKRLHLLSEYCETRRNFAILDSLHSGLIQRIYEGLEELTIYLEPYKSGSITFADYIALKRVGDDEGKEFAAVVDLYKKSTSISSDTLQRLIAIFIESEKKNLLIILDSFAV